MRIAGAARDEIRVALNAHRKSLWAVAGFSAGINLLYLTPSLYMLQVYDHVLTSRSEITLLALTMLAVGLYLLMGFLEWVRAQVLVRVGNALDQTMAPRVFIAAFEHNLRDRDSAAGSAMSDLASVRQF